MSSTRRSFIQQSALVASTAAFVSKVAGAETGHSITNKDAASHMTAARENNMTGPNSNLQPGNTEAMASQQEVSGSYSNSAITMLPSTEPLPASAEDRAMEARIARARLSGPKEVTKDATVAEMDEHGQLTILRHGTNEWTCFPGNENKIGDVPMCADRMGMLWMTDLMARKPKPTNTAPGLMYMLCGATQHSNTDPFDKTSAAIPIGPHWMILWPYDAKKCGLPNTVRDAGAWVMFDGNPYAYLHICGTPWVGNEYLPGNVPTWTMRYTRNEANS